MTSSGADGSVRCRRCDASIEERTRTADPPPDTCADRTRARFDDVFSNSLAVFQMNLLAWQLGMTWEQTQALRRRSERSGVEFDPRTPRQI